jgi:hypothetical protein
MARTTANALAIEAVAATTMTAMRIRKDRERGDERRDGM